jgi:hypothetical protein
MRLWGGLLALACGCGRIGFSAITDRDASGDGVVPAEACPAFASFCDGFESDNLGAWSYSVVTSATLQAESSIVHTGHDALESVGPSSTVFYGWAVHDFPAQTSGILAVREWMYSAQPLVADDQVLTLDGGSANGNDFISVTGGVDNTWRAPEGDGATNTVYADHPSTTPIAQSTWVCIELDVMLATTGSSLILYVADQQVATGSLVTPSPGYKSLGAGNAAVAGAGGTVYVDDVVMAAQHIGCQ